MAAFLLVLQARFHLTDCMLSFVLISLGTDLDIADVVRFCKKPLNLQPNNFFRPSNTYAIFADEP